MLNETQEERWSTIKEKFWKRHEAEGGHASQYWPLVEIVLQRAEAVADAEGLDADGFEEKLLEAEEIVWDITKALRAYWKDPPDTKFWYALGDSWYGYELGDPVPGEKPEDLPHGSAINTRDLDMATARYLLSPA